MLGAWSFALSASSLGAAANIPQTPANDTQFDLLSALFVFMLATFVGLDVIRRGLDDALMLRVARALKESIELARTDEDAAVDYAMTFGRGLDRETCRQFVRMYVNADTVDMGDEGTRALEALYDRAQKRGLLPTSPLLDILRV